MKTRVTIPFLFLLTITPLWLLAQDQQIKEISGTYVANDKLDSLYQILYSKINELEKENRELKDDLMQQRIAKADTIINWSAMMFTILALLIVIAGAVGLREFSRLRQTETSMKEKLDQVKLVLERIEGHKAIIDNELEKVQKYRGEIAQELENIKNQRDKILEDTKKFIEMSYLLNSGIQAYFSSNYIEARELLSKVLEIDPENIQALSFMGRCFVQENNNDEAYATYKHILNINNKVTDGYLGLAWLFADSDKEKALKYCDKALEVNPKCIHALDTKGKIYSKMGLFDEALKCHLESSKLKERFGTYFYIGLNYYAKTELEKSNRYFDKAYYHAKEEIEKNHKNHWAYYVLGVLEGLKGNTENSRNYFTKSINLNNAKNIRLEKKQELLFLKKYITDKNLSKEVKLMLSYLGDDISK